MNVCPQGSPIPRTPFQSFSSLSNFQLNDAVRFGLFLIIPPLPQSHDVRFDIFLLEQVYLQQPAVVAKQGQDHLAFAPGSHLLILELQLDYQAIRSLEPSHHAAKIRSASYSLFPQRWAKVVV
jgi:hypothetical protein